MDLMIELDSDEAARLQAAARNKGMEPAECARQYVLACLPGSRLEEQINGRLDATALRLAARPGDEPRDPELVERVRRARGRFAPSMGVVTSEVLHQERQADKRREEERIQALRQ